MLGVTRLTGKVVVAQHIDLPHAGLTADLFQDRTREAIGFERVIEEYAKIGIGYWCTHDTDVIPTEHLGNAGQDEIVGRIGE